MSDMEYGGAAPQLAGADQPVRDFGLGRRDEFCYGGIPARPNV